MRFQQFLASVKAAELFVGHAEVDDVAPKWNVAAFEIGDGEELGDRDRFHVERTSAPDVSTGLHSAERRLRPLSGRRRHHVNVMQQQKSLLV